MWFHILLLPAKLIKRILLFPLFLFILSGCYNNSHIRTLKVLEEGGRVELDVLVRDLQRQRAQTVRAAAQLQPRAGKANTDSRFK